MNFVDLIKKELQSRRNKNPRYSLRAFARDLSISPASLSSILNDSKYPSTRIIKICCAKLKISKSNLEAYLSERKNKRKLDVQNFYQSRHFVKEDIAPGELNWITFAVSRLAGLKENSSSIDWISNRLNIKKSEAKRALNFLIQQKCIEVKNNKMIYLKRLALVTNIPSETSLKIHESMLNLAKKSLRRVSSEHRQELIQFSLIDKKQITRMAEIIRRSCQEAERIGEKSEELELYATTVHIFPIGK